MMFFISCISTDIDSGQESSIETEEIATYDSNVLPSSTCETSKVPVVFVHGFLAAGDGFDRHAARFANNGHCLDKLFAFDWNNLEQSSSQEDLSIFINNVLEQTRAQQVDLVGHSAGSALSVSMMQDDDQNRVRRYIHVGSSPIDNNLSIPWLNLTSTKDPIAPANEIESVQNVILEQEDHFEVITSQASFAAMYMFLYDEEPTSPEYELSSEPQIWGKALEFGTNIPTKGRLEVYEVEAQTGLPIYENPSYTQEIGTYGFIGPFALSSEAVYEIRLIPNQGPTIHHFFAPFDHDNRFIRLRSLPDEGIATQILSSLPLEEDTSVALVNYSAHSGMIVDRDTLVIDGQEQLNEDRANAENNTIALFHTDVNEDQTSGTDPSSLSLFPFLAGTDTYWEPSSDQNISITFNGNTLHVPRYGEGIILTLQ